MQKDTIIGSDEVLKGDTFGGIVVAAVKANPEQHTALKDLGVRDSKTLSDRQIQLIAPKIEKNFPCIIKNIYPEEYNGLKGTVTDILNKLHKECYNYLKPGTHVVDKFPGCTVGDIIEIQAESKYPEVAAASIIARAHALNQLHDLSKKAGFLIPKGSAHVQKALEQLKKSNLPATDFVKLKFSNVKKIFG